MSVIVSPEPAVHRDPDRGTTYRSVWMHLVDTDVTQAHVRVAGLRTRYVHAGTHASTAGRPVVVMLHGTGGHWETFCANLGPLSEHFDCYALDMVGCGFTDKPDKPYEIRDYVEHVLGFLDAVGIERASFIGVSLGSWVAARLALVAPDRVAALVLNSPAGLLPMSDAARAAGTKARSTVVRDPSWENTQEVLKHLFFDESAMIDDLVAVRQRVYQITAADAGDSTEVRSITLFDPEIRRRNLLSSQEWSSITAPALVIAHVDAPDDYLETGRQIVPLMPNARLAEVHGASHWPHFEQPEVFNELAIDFLTATD